MSDEWVKVYVRRDAYGKAVETLSLAMTPDEWTVLFKRLTPQRTPTRVGTNETTAPAKNPASQNPTN